MSRSAIAATGIVTALSVVGAVSILMTVNQKATRRAAKRAMNAMEETGERMMHAMHKMNPMK